MCVYTCMYMCGPCSEVVHYKGNRVSFGTQASGPPSCPVQSCLPVQFPSGSVCWVTSSSTQAHRHTSLCFYVEELVWSGTENTQHWEQDRSPLPCSGLGLVCVCTVSNPVIVFTEPKASVLLVTTLWNPQLWPPGGGRHRNRERPRERERHRARDTHHTHRETNTHTHRHTHRYAYHNTVIVLVCISHKITNV